MPKQAGTKKSSAALREEEFVRHYVELLNGTEAAIRAGYRPESERTAAGQQAAKLLRRPDIRAAVQRGLDAKYEQTKASAQAVIDRLWGMATADPRELFEVKVGPCRHCYGTEHRYQMTDLELQEAFDAHERAVAKAKDAKRKLPPFDAKGGGGYDRTLDPFPGCPNCGGEGEQRVLVRDTAKLSTPALSLVSAIKQTKEGIEVKTHSQMDALVHVGRHFGIFNDKMQLDAKLKHDAMGDLADFIRGAPTTRLPIKGAK